MNDSHVCDCCRLVPLSYLSLDVAEPISGWEASLSERGIELLEDDLGRPSVERGVLGELIREARVLAERREEDQRRRFERDDLKPPAGVPALEGATPFESLVAAGGVVLPSEEFAGRPKPNFLVEELEAGARMEDDSGGTP